MLGGAGGDNLSGAVTQTGAINAGTVAGNGGSTVTLDGSNGAGLTGGSQRDETMKALPGAKGDGAFSVRLYSAGTAREANWTPPLQYVPKPLL